MKKECASWPLSAAAAPRAAPQSAPATHAAAARRRRARAPASPAGARACAAEGASAAGAALASAARSLSRPGSCSARSRRRWRRTCSPGGELQWAADYLLTSDLEPWQAQEARPVCDLKSVPRIGSQRPSAGGQSAELHRELGSVLRRALVGQVRNSASGTPGTRLQQAAEVLRCAVLVLVLVQQPLQQHGFSVEVLACQRSLPRSLQFAQALASEVLP